MAIIAEGEGTGKAAYVGLLNRIPDGVLTIAIVVLASSASFGVGYMTGKNGADLEPVRIQELSAEGLPAAASISSKAAAPSMVKAKKAEPAGTATAATGTYVASKKGTKYHLPTCSGAKTMSEENKIWFTTKAEAEAAGYTPAGNCKGI